jgi:hypothetical protein
MAKQAVTNDDGKVLIVDTDKGTYTEAKEEREGAYIPILSDILDLGDAALGHPGKRK